MLRYVLTIFIVCATVSLQAEEGWTTDYEAAKATATEEGKQIVAVFGGSDWCGPCKQLKENILSTQEFMQMASKDYVLLELDYPQRKRLPAALRKQNAALQGTYDVSAFPTLLLCDEQGRGYVRLVGGHIPNTGVALLASLKKQAAGGAKLRKAMEKAAKKAGGQRARALEKIMVELDKQQCGNAYIEIMEEIMSLDEDNKAGLYKKYANRLLEIEISSGLDDVQEIVKESKGKDRALALLEGLRQQAEAAQLSKSLQNVIYYIGAVHLYEPENKPEAKRCFQKAIELNKDTDTAEICRQYLRRYK